jgi:hypothetical protein
MSAENIINFLGQFCKESSGDFQRWQGNKSVYHWNRGRDTASGEINGVVRKLAGIDATGFQIWVVAGSFKISPNGTILRFTGLTKENWHEIERRASEPLTTVLDSETHTV